MRVSTEKTKGRKSRQRQPPKVRSTPITVCGQVPIVALQATYGVTRIDGRTPAAQRAKDRFQNDAYRYASALGQALAIHGGFTGQHLTRNRGSQLDAGSVMASYVHPTLPYWLSLYIEADPGKTAIPRPDGVIIIACRRDTQRSRKRERLHYLDPALSSRELAQVLLLLVGLKRPADLEAPVAFPFGAGAQGLEQLTLFGEPPAAVATPRADAGPVVRVWLLGAYRQCVLLQSGRTSVEVACIDGHPRVALAYWGQRITRPLWRVHPDDQALCALPGAELTPGQAHLGNRG